MSPYKDLTREQLEQRLRLAENVCIVFGWAGLGSSPRSRAAYHLWARWARTPGVDVSVGANALLADVEGALAIGDTETIDAVSAVQ